MAVSEKTAEFLAEIKAIRWLENSGSPNDMKRDLAWACVEKVLDMPGFFTMLKEIYKEGYFPCSWNGAYPSGQAVVL